MERMALDPVSRTPPDGPALPIDAGVACEPNRHVLDRPARPGTAGVAP